MGVNLWGESPLYVNPVNIVNILTKILAEGKAVAVKHRLKEVWVQNCGLTIGKYLRSGVLIQKASTISPRLDVLFWDIGLLPTNPENRPLAQEKGAHVLLKTMAIWLDTGHTDRHDQSMAQGSLPAASRKGFCLSKSCG